jgi:hypothetical protein
VTTDTKPASSSPPRIVARPISGGRRAMAGALGAKRIGGYGQDDVRIALSNHASGRTVRVIVNVEPENPTTISKEKQEENDATGKSS